MARLTQTIIITCMAFGHAWLHHSYVHLPKFSGNFSEQSHSKYSLSIPYSPSFQIRSG